MVQAIWNGAVIADSNDTVVVEGNHYFPPESVERELLRDSDLTTYCGWKGTANYYDLVVEGQTNAAAAWYYRQPLEAAHDIAGRIAFWKGVEIVD